VQYTIDYFWVVVCKNRRFHHKGNIGYEHKILPEATRFHQRGEERRVVHKPTTGREPKFQTPDENAFPLSPGLCTVYDLCRFTTG
jgi:hypothetical protein